MRKFLAVVRHEYKKIVMKWAFLVGTFLFPVLGIGFLFVPALIFSIKGEPVRMAIVDRQGTLAGPIRANLSREIQTAKAAQRSEQALKDINISGSGTASSTMSLMAQQFTFVDLELSGLTTEEIRSRLTEMTSAKSIDAFLIVPDNWDAPDAEFEFLSRKVGDISSNELVRDAVNDAVRSKRLADANIDEAAVKGLSKRVNIEMRAIDEQGREKDSSLLLAASFIIGLMIYITLAIYGQVILGAVVEEKETRIAEILFSSARPFELMMGKLVGVGLAGLTQLSIWVTSIALLATFVALRSDLNQYLGGVPQISPLLIVYFLVFFLLGYFIYASIFALIGSMVTTVQEGGQFSFPPIMLMLVGFYLGFAVIRDPNSTLSFWVSIAPFFAPLTMPVRILAETPPFWQIALAIGINALAIAGLVWLASRVYRVGMLMYGKRATIPEVIRWIRQV
jgi:ABC-2 type transport system permease protein